MATIYRICGFNGGIDVLVLPNGDVIGANGHLHGSGNGHAVSVMSPLDFWAPGSRLAAAAIRGLTNRVSAAAVKGFHALRAPTKELAKSTVARMSGKTLKGGVVSGVSKMAKSPPRALSQQEQELTEVLTDMVLRAKGGGNPHAWHPPNTVAPNLNTHIVTRGTLAPDLKQAELALREAEKMLKRNMPSDSVRREQMRALAERLRTKLRGL